MLQTFAVIPPLVSRRSPDPPFQKLTISENPLWVHRTAIMQHLANLFQKVECHVGNFGVLPHAEHIAQM